VDKVDTTAGTVTVLGIQVTVDSTTRVEDRSAGRSQFFRLSDVKVGDPVEIRGYESPANSNKVVAVRLERWSSLPEPRIRGPVRSATSPQFTVLATPVATTNTTRFDGAAGSLTQTQFFATAGLVGQVVDVRGSWNGTTLTASRVQLGMHDD
jgi:hypothetical protein